MTNLYTKGETAQFRFTRGSGSINPYPIDYGNYHVLKNISMRYFLIMRQRYMKTYTRHDFETYYETVFDRGGMIEALEKSGHLKEVKADRIIDLTYLSKEDKKLSDFVWE